MNVVCWYNGESYTRPYAMWEMVCTRTNVGNAIVQMAVTTKCQALLVIVNGVLSGVRAVVFMGSANKEF